MKITEIYFQEIRTSKETLNYQIHMIHLIGKMKFLCNQTYLALCLQLFYEKPE